MKIWGANTSRWVGFSFALEFALLIFCIKAPDFFGNPVAAYLVEMALIGPTLFALLLILRYNWSSQATMLVAFGHSIFIILIFAAVYSATGLRTENGMTRGFSEALFVSLSMWTSLGFGEYRPREPLMIFAAIQSVFGYVFLGMIVGLLADIFARSHR